MLCHCFSRGESYLSTAPPAVYQPGQLTDRTVLNVYGGYSETRVYGFLLDKYKLGKLDQEFYKDTDLSIGTTINVWGRKVLLCFLYERTSKYTAPQGNSSQVDTGTGGGSGNPLQYSCLGNPMDREAWQGYSPWGSQRVGHD